MTSSQSMSTRRRRWSVLIVATLVAAVLATGTATGPVSADPLTITDASFRWRVNAELQGTSPFGECNYLSAGASDGSEATYRASQGNVRVEKAGGTPTWATKCQLDDTRQTDQELIWTGGTGTVDPDTGEATVAFEGTVSIAFYGGLLPFSIVDPVFTVDAQGNGTMIATMDGFASSMEDPHNKEPLEPVPGVVVADLRDVDSANDTGFTATPIYGGVTYDADPTIAMPQNRTLPGWGSWPESFVDFHMETGLSSYWYTSGGAFDSKKPPTAIQITYDGIGEPLPPETTTTTAPRPTTTTTAPSGTGPSAPPPAAPPASPQSPGGTTTYVPAAPTRTTTFRTVNPGGPSGSSGAASDPGPGLAPGTDGTMPDPSGSGSSSGALAWSVPAGGVVASAGDELGPIAIADTRTTGQGWTVTGRFQGTVAGWTPKLLREGAGAELGFAVDSGLSRPAVLARARSGNPAGWATLAADLELGNGDGPVTVTITAIS